MTRSRVLTAVLLVLGFLFSATGVYALQADVAPYAQMIAALNGTLGIFLLLAARNPAANRSLILFAGWSNIVHGVLMGVQTLEGKLPRSGAPTDVLPVIIFGLVLLALAPKAVPAPAVRSDPTAVSVA